MLAVSRGSMGEYIVVVQKKFISILPAWQHVPMSNGLYSVMGNKILRIMRNTKGSYGGMKAQKSTVFIFKYFGVGRP